MVSSVLGANHQALRDWVVQRVTAVIIALCVLGLAYYFISHPNVSFVEWRMLFAPVGMKVFALLVVLSVAFHAWVGIWTVVTDYVKCASLRFLIHVLVVLTLLACFLWSLLIVWGF